MECAPMLPSPESVVSVFRRMIHLAHWARSLEHHARAAQPAAWQTPAGTT
jgi:hypothetical protein